MLPITSERRIRDTGGCVPSGFPDFTASSGSASEQLFQKPEILFRDERVIRPEGNRLFGAFPRRGQSPPE
jgi:hypothetical protein